MWVEKLIAEVWSKNFRPTFFDRLLGTTRSHNLDRKALPLPEASKARDSATLT